MSINSITKMALTTLAVMFVMNQLAGISPAARQIIKGSVVVPVNNNDTTAKVWV